MKIDPGFSAYEVIVYLVWEKFFAYLFHMKANDDVINTS